MLLYDDKPAVTAAKEHEDEPGKPTRVLDVAVPEGKTGGDSFVYALPGGVGEATITVPEGAG